MANLKEIRNRIASVHSTRQITSAMKMVSAAKFKKSQSSIVRMRPYANKLYEIFRFVSSSLESTDEANIYTVERDEIQKVLIVLITSSKGLCGAFNQHLYRKVNDLITGDYKYLCDEELVEFFAIGKKGYEFLKKKKYKVANYEPDLLDGLTFEKAEEVIEGLLKKYVNEVYDKIIIVYNEFKNAATQIPTIQDYLPVNLIEEGKGPVKKHDYIFEPSKEFIINELIYKSLKIQFYKALLDSNAAEHGARMTAMHQATDNATKMLNDLKLTYNKARQDTITKEILEITGGAEALGK